MSSWFDILAFIECRRGRLFGLPLAARLVRHETHAHICMKDILNFRYMGMMHPLRLEWASAGVWSIVMRSA